MRVEEEEGKIEKPSERKWKGESGTEKEEESGTGKEEEKERERKREDGKGDVNNSLDPLDQ